MNETGFRLIAIMPLEGCDPKYLKILQQDQAYYFFNNIRIEKDKFGFEKIIQSEDVVPRIYDIGELKINITAVVGKNGSGKSSLLELLYVAFYNISKQQKILPKKDDDGEIYLMVPDIRVAIYYSLNSVFYKLEQNDKNTTLYEFNTDLSGYKKESRVDKRNNIDLLFYNIVINYSHYSLNTKDLGHWLKAIFHKNDGYQTPIVLNPFREDGIIDINRENYLVRSRLLANIVGNVKGIFSFGKREKIPLFFRFQLDNSKFRLKKNSYNIAFDRTHSVKRFVIPTVYKMFFDNENFKPKDSPLNDYALEYILKKLYSISAKYKHYFKYRGFSAQKSNQRLVAYLKALKKDTSHITFKLKQALNFLRFDIIDKNNEYISIDVDVLKYNIRKVQDDHNIPTIELLPPAFLQFDIEFVDSGDQFSRFSSGEKQKIYAYSSLVYHLKNLDSILADEVDNDTTSVNLLKYNNINVIFDEIELYYHPDLQRRFIGDLLKCVEGADLQLIKSINFIFITHSPFVLSDIPTEQTLYLDVFDGKALQRFPAGNTFGGNIHELLAHSFFLDEAGYIGEHAKDILNQAYDYLDFVIRSQGKYKGDENVNGWNRSRIRKLIDMTGEVLIQSSLNELYYRAFLTNRSAIDQEIERLQRLKNKL